MRTRSRLVFYVGLLGLLTAAVFDDVVVAITAATAILWNEVAR